jgi:hypothetical protein
MIVDSSLASYFLSARAFVSSVAPSTLDAQIDALVYRLYGLTD